MEARDRRFYSLPKSEETTDTGTTNNKDQLLSYIRNNIVGKQKVFSGPFGLREALYLDYTASGKSLSFIEDYIRDEVLPEYGNTHTTTSVTSLQTTLYRHEARDIIRNAVHASEHDSVIFVGSGSTGAIHKLIHNLQLDRKPVVFVGPYEHHSNLLPWKEIGSKVIRVRTDKDGLVDQRHLQDLLQKWQQCGRQLIGCFSAASNITGILVDVDAINVLLHKHNALAFWDYATAGPYVKVDMNPVSTAGDQQFMYKDAVFMSCHKFVGGVQTPGVLIAKKKLFKNNVPDGCGGGSIFFVRREGHRYLQEPELKEEGGTPAIVEAVRAGLVVQLKEAVSPSLIMEREERMCSRAVEAWQGCPSLILLGPQSAPRLPIFSFLVYHGASGRFLHHNYVSTLLNDLFGIQARGGCACAGPYAMDLLGMEENISELIENILAEDSRLDRTHLRRYREYSQREIIRPGFTRINLPYFLDDDTVSFVLDAIKLVAEEGWKLLPQYMFNPETGEWRQKNFQVFKDRKWLGHISYGSGEMAYKVPSLVVKGPRPTDYQDCLQKARDLFTQASKTKYQLADHTVMFDEESKPFRWFTLPSEAAQCLHGNVSQNAYKLPFCPPSLRERLGLPVFVGESGELAGDAVDDWVGTDVTAAGDDDIVDMINQVTSQVGSGASRENDDFSEGLKTCLDRGFGDEAQESTSELVGAVKSSVSTTDVVPSTSSKCLSSDHRNVTVVPGSETTEQKQGVVLGQKLGISEDKSGIDSNSICSLSRTCNTNTEQKQGFGQKHEVGSGLSEDKSGIDSNSVCRLNRPCNTDDVMVPAVTGVCAGGVCPMIKTNTVKCAKSGSDMCTKSFNDGSGDKEDASMKQMNDGDSDKQLPDSSGDRKEAPGKRSNDDKTDKQEPDRKKRKDCKWFSPPKDIFTPFHKAVEEFHMIQNGDRVLVCLSGGKDSLSLLHTMHQYQFYCRKKNITFEMGAVTVDPQTPSYDPSPLKAYLASLGVPYFYESQSIMEQAAQLPYQCASICSFCSRMKRGIIYKCARREGYNVVTLGQHLDDLCESFMMSVFHNGLLRTMKAHYTVEDGDLRVARPFMYVREKDLRSFAEKNKLPVIAENCPACFEAPKERHRIKQLLATQEIMFPRIYPSMLAAIKPVMAISKTGVNMADILAKVDNTSDDDMDI